MIQIDKTMTILPRFQLDQRLGEVAAMYVDAAPLRLETIIHPIDDTEIRVSAVLYRDKHVFYSWDFTAPISCSPDELASSIAFTITNLTLARANPEV
jgi:hypothetical protein